MNSRFRLYRIQLLLLQEDFLSLKKKMGEYTWYHNGRIDKLSRVKV